MTQQGRAASEVEGRASTEAEFHVWLTSMELVSIEVVKMVAERREAGLAPQTQFNLAAGWQAENDVKAWRYDVSAHLTDDTGTDFGAIEVSVVVSGRSDVEPEPAYMDRFGATSGVMMAHPYLREAIASTALRLGFPGVLLPALIAPPPPDK